MLHEWNLQIRRRAQTQGPRMVPPIPKFVMLGLLIEFKGFLFFTVRRQSVTARCDEPLCHTDTLTHFPRAPLLMSCFCNEGITMSGFFLPLNNPGFFLMNSLTHRCSPGRGVNLIQ